MNEGSLEGYLDKQGGIRKNWKKRYFKLRTASNQIDYYNKKGDVDVTRPLGTIQLNPRSVAKTILTGGYRPGREFEDCGFCVEDNNSTSRTWILIAPSKVNRDLWIKKIDELLSVNNKDQNPSNDKSSDKNEEANRKKTYRRSIHLTAKLEGEDDIEMLKNEVEKRDQQLSQLKGDFKSKKDELEDIQAKYFMNIGVFAKTNFLRSIQDTKNGNIKIDLYELYELVVEEKVPVSNWASWVDQQLKGIFKDPNYLNLRREEMRKDRRKTVSLMSGLNLNSANGNIKSVRFN
eukprot:TRINITY_DN27464_c0_g1_i1.p1 TRINITY_DN27464_c0_g1~~TRINITY_DN27464_c0_g1_i1.p1  ORF type:complete len:290 (-),score=62.31 TRINITY_DN27464_c0_g1_i1:64-933(-)